MTTSLALQHATPDSSAIAVSTTPITVALCVAVLAFMWLRRRSARQRDSALAARWAWMTAQTRPSGPWLAHVTRVYQHAHRGSKAYVTWCGTKHVQDTWFKQWQASPGTYVLVTGRSGFGPHNRNPQTFFVDPGDVLEAVPGDAPSVWRRHQKRAARQARRRRRFTQLTLRASDPLRKRCRWPAIR